MRETKEHTLASRFVVKELGEKLITKRFKIPKLVIGAVLHFPTTAKCPRHLGAMHRAIEVPAAPQHEHSHRS